MFDIITLIAAIAVIAKCAELEGRSGFIWGSITFVICLASAAIPLPFINIVIGFVISFIALFAVKVISKPKA